VKWLSEMLHVLTSPDGKGILFFLYLDFAQFDKAKKDRVDSGTNGLYEIQKGCFKKKSNFDLKLLFTIYGVGMYS
jgi:hypothetical protein